MWWVRFSHSQSSICSKMYCFKCGELAQEMYNFSYCTASNFYEIVEFKVTRNVLKFIIYHFLTIFITINEQKFKKFNNTCINNNNTITIPRDFRNHNHRQWNHRIQQYPNTLWYQYYQSSLKKARSRAHHILPQCSGTETKNKFSSKWLFSDKKKTIFILKINAKDIIENQPRHVTHTKSNFTL